uniref:Uncharacterized protein n=1 Tax=Pipistrellus kuhlii TaxID=59472 RepID=A0A7J7X034_PIPKU|nr:hypothetical protein mPipKuh1_010722 [Pipistrellus kuhlii]
MSMLGNTAMCNRKPHTDRVPTRQTLTDSMVLPTSGTRFGSETEAAARRGEGSGPHSSRPSLRAGPPRAHVLLVRQHARQRGHTATHGLASARPAASLELASRGPEKDRDRGDTTPSSARKQRLRGRGQSRAQHHHGTQDRLVTTTIIIIIIMQVS